MGVKGYKVYDINSQSQLISRDVQFFEHIFPYSFPQNYASNSSDFILPIFPNFDLSTLDPPISPLNNTSSVPLVSESSSSSSSSSNFPIVVPEVNDPIHALHDSSTEIVPKRSTRIHKLPTYLTDYYHGFKQPSTTNFVFNPSTAYPIQHFLTFDRLSSAYKTFTLSVLSTIEPQYFSQAIVHDHWKNAIKEELNAL